MNLERRAALQASRAVALSARLERLLPGLTGRERALDVGAGLGAFALALAPRVAEMVAIEQNAEQVSVLRESVPANVQVRIGDGEHLDLPSLSFDLAGALRVLHHTPRPELLVAELVRVTRPGGTILVVDQLAPVDPLAARALNEFERARDSSTTRLLSDQDMRALFDANDLTVVHDEVDRESRALDSYLDLAGCEGDEREAARALAPSSYEALVGWYVLRR